MTLVIINAVNTRVSHWLRLSATEVCGNQAFDLRPRGEDHACLGMGCLPEGAKEQFQIALARWLSQRCQVVTDDMFEAEDYPGRWQWDHRARQWVLKEEHVAFSPTDQFGTRKTVPFVVSMTDLWPLGACPPREMKGSRLNIPFLAPTEDGVVFIGVRVPHGSNATPGRNSNLPLDAWVLTHVEYPLKSAALLHHAWNHLLIEVMAFNTRLLKLDKQVLKGEDFMGALNAMHSEFAQMPHALLEAVDDMAGYAFSMVRLGGAMPDTAELVRRMKWVRQCEYQLEDT